MKMSRLVSIVAAAAALSSGMALAADPATDAASIARGKYIVQIGGLQRLPYRALPGGGRQRSRIRVARRQPGGFHGAVGHHVSGQPAAVDA